MLHSVDNLALSLDLHHLQPYTLHLYLWRDVSWMISLEFLLFVIVIRGVAHYQQRRHSQSKKIGVSLIKT
jgi:hypothetical protein